MNASVASLSEFAKTLTDSFRLSAIFPALFFLLLNRLFIFRHFENLPLFSGITGQGLWDQALILSLLAILIGYTINAIEISIVRFYEGYPWRNSLLGRCLTDWQRGHLTWLESKIDELEKALLDEYDRLLPDQITEAVMSLDARVKDYTAEKESGFPPDAAGILPTRLGNVIAAFEAYPGKRYGMDGVTFWPRMFPILAREGFLPYITQARSTMDFLLNISLLMSILGIECILLRIFFTSNISWLLPLLALVAAWVFYASAINSAYTWAALFQVAFDLFRYHLASALGLKLATTFERERTQWSKLPEFWNGDQDPKEFNEFDHSKTDWPVLGTRKKEVEQ